ncbi:MAG: phosphate acyltransferase PlsX [Proteobacteria bacterium]|nr:phosphate acyltransferase PlsX [Pseudomonadota bacterium]MCP4915767.1 phosphate acyltransferase PlsX [Pseudomonadota bacterium]
MSVTVALDAMGSDAGPAAVVEGVAQLSREDVDVHVLLVGDEPQLSTLLAEQRYDASRIAVVHASQVVGMGKKPNEELDAKLDASVLVAASLVKQGQADALVSAGSTGGVVLAAARTFERLPGIRRAALAAVYPTELRHGPRDDPFALMLDVGATLNCSAEDLVGFAVMGSAYSRIVSDIGQPKVALLSNGTEASKGTPAIVEAHQRLLEMPGVNFQGNVEGLDIPRGTVDVIVCEGFLGNVVLKMLEGVSEVVSDIARDAYARKFVWKVGLTMLSQGLRQIRTMTDWKQYGGAPVLGFDHVVIKAHGRSNARAVRNALKVAAKAVRRDLAGEIARGLSD